MNRRISGVLLAMLLTLSLPACGDNTAVDLYEPGYASSGGTGSLVDLPVAEPEDGGQSSRADGSPGNLPDVSQAPSGSQSEEGNRPADKGEDQGNQTVDEDGWYSSKEDVALYIHLYEHLPDNYVTKDEAEDAGWSGGNVERWTGEGTAIGGSSFGNREGLLPKAQGRTYTECDIDTVGGNSRGAKRIVFSNDGLVYYTEDHYESFELLYGEP